MKNVWYDITLKRLIVGGSPPWATPKIYMGKRSELEVKIMRSEVERGVFRQKEWVS